MRVLERVAEHYDTQDVEFGRVYRWCPEYVVVECECGTRRTFKKSDLIRGSVTPCKCGKDDPFGFPEEQDEVAGHLIKDDTIVHPWRYWHPGILGGMPC